MVFFKYCIVVQHVVARLSLVVARLDRATQYPPRLHVVLRSFDRKISWLLGRPVKPGGDGKVRPSVPMHNDEVIAKMCESRQQF